ncbi:asparagine synthase [Paenibacillus xerothermodurans]|uniref:Asparagine synthase n=1 Tax=Paenibacillus xerothermodurans TaxID=1977292 RepID=A0A2W1NBW0_PAEXE|nr:asparagine synthase [Paenibacillus xerothermodurans]PZE21434.1 asparagine synthase [Paenibacillus xerothermodurans]
MREGLIPTVLGTAVTAAGVAAMRMNYPTAGAAAAGFGLAHVVLGTIDMMQHGKQMKPYKHP